MNAIFAVGVLLLGFVALFAWSFRHLPQERWQILAVVPWRREANGTWRGVNLTYYGVFNTMAVAASMAVAIFLPGTVGLSMTYLTWCFLAIMAICLTASNLINRIVEGHWHGFTIGGASFVGMVAGPWIAWGMSHLILPSVDSVPAVLYVLGALASAYALGEGIGRLACISFGCCYGRPLVDCPAWLQKLFNHRAAVFEGRLKKACYAHGLEGQRLIPVQAATAIVSSVTGLFGIACFLSGRPMLAYVLPVVVTQLWRFVSEFLRADYRGTGRLSAYQGMALAGAAYTVLLGMLWPDIPRPTPDAARGLALLWTPGAILLIEAVAVFVFFRMGLSTMTTSHTTFDLRHDRLNQVKQV